LIVLTLVVIRDFGAQSMSAVVAARSFDLFGVSNSN